MARRARINDTFLCFSPVLRSIRYRKKKGGEKKSVFFFLNSPVAAFFSSAAREGKEKRKKKIAIAHGLCVYVCVYVRARVCMWVSRFRGWLGLFACLAERELGFSGGRGRGLIRCRSACVEWSSASGFSSDHGYRDRSRGLVDRECPSGVRLEPSQG